MHVKALLMDVNLSAYAPKLCFSLSAIRRCKCKDNPFDGYEFTCLRAEAMLLPIHHPLMQI